MNSLTNQQLLRSYAEHCSETAFAELVRRHIDLIYSAAVRMVRDTHVAEDVTQGVFVALAQNASQLTDRPILSGWLHRTAQNLAANAVRSDVRRRAREQEAAAMNDSFSVSAEPDALWEHIAPHLDAALGELNEADRDVLLLRYFENKSLREVGQQLGVSDDAAQKRVSRAVERLRAFFSRRGVKVGAGGLVVLVSANAVQAAPAGLAVTVSTSVALAGTTLAATATATATKAIAMTLLQKTLVTTTVVVLSGIGIYEAYQTSQLSGRVQTLRREQGSLATKIGRLQKERDEASNRAAFLAEQLANRQIDHAELLKLRSSVTDLLQRNRDLSSLSNSLVNSSNENSRIVNYSDYAIPDSWANAGFDSPTATARTYLWAMANTNAAKLNEVLSVSPEFKDGSSEFDLKKGISEFVSQGGLFGDSSVKGARIVSATRVGIGPDAGECVFMVELMEDSIGTSDSDEPIPIRTLNTEPLVVRRIGGTWRVVFPGGEESSPENLAEEHADASNRDLSKAPQ